MSSRLFPMGSIVSPEDLIGRESFLRNVVTRLSDGQHLLWIGPRRIGKTSLANEVLRRAQQEHYYIAYVDLFREESETAFLQTLANRLLENQTGIKKTLSHLKNSAHGTINTVDLHMPWIGLDLALELSHPQLPLNILREKVFELSETLATRHQRKVLIVFDEFQDAAKFGGDKFYKSLRSAIQHHQSTTYLFLGSQAGLLHQLFSKAQEPFYRFALPMTIPMISEEAWQTYIIQKFADRHITFPSELITFLLDQTGGHPQDTMTVCAETYYVMLEAESPLVTYPYLTLGLSRSMEILRNDYDAIWANLQHLSQGQEVIHRLALGQRPYHNHAPSAEVARALQEMIHRGILTKEGRGIYQFVEPLFAQMIRQLHELS